MAVAWGVDVGVGSIGFAVIEVDGAGEAVALLDGVSRIFPVAEGGTERRLKRGMRTQTQRRADRRAKLRDRLANLFGLPADFDARTADLALLPEQDGPAVLDRCHLRALGLSRALTPGDLARALMHLANNRGRRLTRGLKEDEEQEARSDGTSMADAANNTAAELRALGKELGQDQAATPGQLLYRDRLAGKSTRLRKDRPDAPVFTRTMVADEFERLLQAQAPHHADRLTPEVIDELVAAFGREEDPRPPRIGACCYGIGDQRLARGTDLFQTKRIYEELNHIRLRDRLTAVETPLTLDQRNILAGAALAGETITAAGLRRLLKLGRAATDPLSTLDERKSQKGNRLPKEIAAHAGAAMCKSAGVVEVWLSWPVEQREAFCTLLREEEEIDLARTALMTGFGLSEEAAEILTKAALPTGYAAAGRTATQALLDQLRADVVPLRTAEDRAGLKRPEVEKINDQDPLPYYGKLFPLSCVGASLHPLDPLEERFGRIPNPVVHAVLNQLRKLAKRYLKIYGRPERINVEVARDLNKSAEERDRIAKDNAKNQNQRAAWAKDLMLQHIPPTRDNMQKLKLWEWQRGKCLYSGREISREMLFDGSVEVDHILPYARTFDNRLGNLALAVTAANRHKADRSPSVAFAQGYDGKDYPSILKRVEETRPGSLWRFQPDAMDRFDDADYFKERFLNDTRYIAKMTAGYLRYVLADEHKSAGMVSLSGGITAQLRSLWGLDGLIADMMHQAGRLPQDLREPKEDPTEEMNRRKALSKVRWDHRHHLLDAVVAACTTRSDVQRIQTLAGQVGDPKLLSRALLEMRDRGESLLRETGLPWRDGFRSILRAFLENSGPGGPSRVSHKPDHGTAGRLHAETNYAVICPVHGQADKFVTANYVPLTSLTKRDFIDKHVRADGALKTIEQSVQGGSVLYWGGDDPVAALENLRRSLNGLADALHQRFEEAPNVDADGKPMNEEQRMAHAVVAHAASTGQRRYRRFQYRGLAILNGPVHDGAAPLRAVEPSGNDRFVYWRDADLVNRVEINTVLQVNAGTFKEAWQTSDGAVLMFRLRKGDIVEMTLDPLDPSCGRGLFLLRSFSPEHHRENQPPHSYVKFDALFSAIEDDRDGKLVRSPVTRIRSLAAFEARQPVHVRLDESGRPLTRSRRRNQGG